MASGVKLVYTFTDAQGKKVQYSYNHANPSATTSQVTTFANALITNTAVLARSLVSVDKIMQVTTSESVYDINGFELATRQAPEVINGNPDIPDTDGNTAATVTKIG